MIKTRSEQPAFHPNAAFQILEMGPRVFAIARYHEAQTIYALTNISSKPVTVSVQGKPVAEQMEDLLTGQRFDPGSIGLDPYQFVWLTTSPHCQANVRY